MCEYITSSVILAETWEGAVVGDLRMTGSRVPPTSASKVGVPHCPAAATCSYHVRQSYIYLEIGDRWHRPQKIPIYIGRLGIVGDLVCR